MPTNATFESSPYPELWQHRVRDGTVVRFRSARPSDATAVREAMATSSMETLRHRFFAVVRGLSDQELRNALDLDPRLGRCFVGEWGDGSVTALVCGIRFVRMEALPEAELAMTVHDRFQRQGLGRALLTLAARLAADDGIEVFRALVLPSNGAMRGLLARTAPGASESWEGELVCFRFSVSDVLQAPERRRDV